MWVKHTITVPPATSTTLPSFNNRFRRCYAQKRPSSCSLRCRRLKLFTREGKKQALLSSFRVYRSMQMEVLRSKAFHRCFSFAMNVYNINETTISVNNKLFNWINHSNRCEWHMFIKYIDLSNRRNDLCTRSWEKNLLHISRLKSEIRNTQPTLTLPIVIVKFSCIKIICSSFRPCIIYKN